MTELTVSGACHHDCPDTCAWQVTVVDGVATKLRGSETHPVTRGTLCPKVNRFLDRVYHPERIRQPLRRVGPKGSGDFEPITWEEALSVSGGRIRQLMDAGRASSILQFSFAGTQGIIQMGIMIDRLFDTIGASDIRRELCGTTASAGASDVLGVPFGIDPESLRYAKTIVLWGTNTRITNRHLWPTLEEARADGALIIVIDPVRTDTAREADVFFQVRPGSDVALVLGLVHVLERDGLLDPEWLRERTTGWEELRDSARSWTPERAAIVTGLDEERITWLAHRLATARPTGIRALIGPEHRENGREIMRAIAALPAILGSWRDVGGGLARSTHVWHSTALATPTDRPVRRSVNMARLGQVLCEPTEFDPHIDMLVVHNSNPAVILPDQNRVVAGLEREDLFTVVIEQFMTDTARYADIVLPATTQVEHLDLADAWGHFYLALNQPAIAPVGEALPNTEISRRLAKAIGLDDPLLQQSDEELIRAVLDSGHPFLQGVTFESLASEGWVRLAVPEGTRPHVDELPGIPIASMRLGRLEHRSGNEAMEAIRPDLPLALISRKQHPKFLNANYGGFPAHLPSSGVPSLQIHGQDAQPRGISTGDIVRVHNDRGELTLRAEVSEDLQPGLVAIPFGWWHRSSPERRAVNALTNATLPNDDRGSAYFHDTRVQVTLIEPRAEGLEPG
jgi:anaerobic selenocysteine-containing dehydrogenase